MPQDSDPRLDLIRDLQAAKVPEDRILDLLDRYDAEGGVSPYEQQVGAQSGTTPRTRMQVAAAQAQEKEQAKGVGKGIAGAAIVGGAAYLGGLPLAAMAPEGYSVLAGIGGQTAGAYGGELLRQRAFGEKSSQREARKAALFTAAPAAAGYVGTKVLGAAGGVPPAASEYVGARSRVVPRFDLTMAEPKTTAELDLGRRIGATVEAQGRPLTPGRVAEKSIISQSTQAGTRIDPQPIIDTLKQRMLKTPKTAGGRNYNRNLQNLADELWKSKQTGGMTPDELDELIGGELDPSIYRGGKPSGKLTAKGLVPARESARKSLLGALPPEAAMERAKAAAELTRRETAASYFGASERTVTNNIRNLFKPGNEGALESLRGVSKQAGIDFEMMARDLATKRAFNADDRVEAGMLHRIMLSLGVVGIISGKPGYVAAGLLSQPTVARMGAKTLAPMQMLLGPAGALMSQRYKETYPLRREQPKISSHSADAPEVWKETRISPEKMFEGMTNAPAQGSQ